MNSARFSINSDDVFYLEHIIIIDGLVSAGLTLFVDQEFRSYSDMTLIQYAIAKRKPKTLEFLLKKAKDDLKIKEEDIMFPKTSNTLGSLLNLAVKFGSKSDYYDSEDNRCLEVIIKLLSIGSQKLLEKSLVEAIQSKNNKALDILLQNNADFFSPLDKNTDDIENEMILYEMPIMTLFMLHNNEEELANIFDEVLPKEVSTEIIERLQKLKVKGKDFISCLHREKAKNFLAGRFVNNEDKLIHIENESEKIAPENIDEKVEDHSDSPKIVCADCGKEEDLQKVGDKFYCSDCILNH